MPTKKHVDRSDDVARSGQWVGRGWAAVALIPVFFFLAVALGYVVYDVFGYQPENDDAPFCVDLICTVTISVIGLVT